LLCGQEWPWSSHPPVPVLRVAGLNTCATTPAFETFLKVGIYP
jgi:hypothetical protein